MVRPGLLVTELPLKPVLLLKGAHRFSFSIAVSISIQNFKEISFEEINPRIKMQRRTREAFTYTFSQVLMVFWPGSAFRKSSAPGSCTPCCTWGRRWVGGHCLRVGVHSAHCEGVLASEGVVVKAEYIRGPGSLIYKRILLTGLSSLIFI